MLAIAISPVEVRPTSNKPAAAKAAFSALADTAGQYLDRMIEAIKAGRLPARSALLSHVRGTGPGVSFTRLVAAMEQGLNVMYESPFEGSHNVQGATLEAANVLANPSRDDAFLFLAFAPNTRDLPLHTHDFSERFIFVLRGRGFFHVAPTSLQELEPWNTKSLAVRERDVLMFTRETVHTFSTTDEPLFLLSYHRPYLPLEDKLQYTVPMSPLFPDHVHTGRGRISFDVAWSCLTA